MKERIVFYESELTDDFAVTSVENPKYIDEDYNYDRFKNIFFRIIADILYYLIVKPISWFILKAFYRYKIVNKKAFKQVKKQGYFIFANHTNYMPDAFIPNHISLKRNYIIVSNQAVSIKGIKNLVASLGGVPLGDTVGAKKNFLSWMKKTIEKKEIVTIYPEAHIWPYFTGIRNFSSESLKYPILFKAPVFTLTICYQRRKHGYYPRIVTYVNGPFYPDNNLNNKEKLNKLYTEVITTMKENAKNHSTYEYVRYEKSVKALDYKLYNGNTIPAISFGTWQIPDGIEAYNSTLFALKVGYRHIDTAYAYGNEKSIGKAIKDSNIERSKIYVTTKCPDRVKTYDGCITHFNESLKNLGLDYIDLYLIHAPWLWSDVGGDYEAGNVEVWKAMIELYNAGKIKAIGVSNFSIKNIENLITHTGFKPMVNQIRWFIGNTQKELTKYCMDNDILIEAYSPLATGKLLENPTIIEISKKYNKSVAQISLRYCIQKGVLPLPKSTHEERIKANLDLDFIIKDEDIAELDKIHNPSLDRPLRS